MKKYLLTSAAIAVMSATSASAADMATRPYTKAPMAAPAAVYDWTGFYIGGHVGGAFRGNSDNLVGGGNDGRFMGGGQIGWDTQFGGNWVFGLEANYSFLDTGSSFANRGLGSVTGRLGSAWGPTLLYVKGVTLGLTHASPTASPATQAVTATPSAAVLNTCSTGTGLARSNINTTISVRRHS